jgi:hypothetical protein
MNEALEEAQRHVRRKRILYIVLGIWIVLSVMWFLIDLGDGGDSWWFYWPMLGTGIGVAIMGTCSSGSADSSAPSGSNARSRIISAVAGNERCPTQLDAH